MDYSGKLILAPMVRIGTLPMRLLALDCGADIVYCEEIIDYKMLQSTRVINHVLNTVDYVLNDGTVIFRTCNREKEKVVFQIGTADATRALQVAKMVENDVAAIDINMGCPKEFSVKGGMGAALLCNPEKVYNIVSRLTADIKKPVSCKIRLLPTFEETVSFLKLLEGCGAVAVAIHGRTREERSHHQNHNDQIKRLAEIATVPIIANGGSKELRSHNDLARFAEDCGCSSVMVARAAMWNPSIFRQSGTELDIDEMAKQYLKLAIEFDNPTQNTKYCVQQMMHERLESTAGKALLASSSLNEICSIWGLEEYYIAVKSEQVRRATSLNKDLGTRWKSKILDDGSEMIEMEFRFNRRDYSEHRSPKQALYEWSVKQRLSSVKYITTYDVKEKMYYSLCIFHGKTFASTVRDKSKKCAEQAAAAVCLAFLGLDDGQKATTDKNVCANAAKRMRCNMDSEIRFPMENNDNNVKTNGALNNGNAENENVTLMKDPNMTSNGLKLERGEMEIVIDNGFQLIT